MRSLSLRLALPALALAACGPATPEHARADIARDPSPTITAVVLPQQVSLLPVGPGDQPVGVPQTITVQPVLAGEHLELQPVTR